MVTAAWGQAAAQQPGCGASLQRCADGSVLIDSRTPAWRQGPPPGDYQPHRAGPAFCPTPGDRCADGTLYAGPHPERPQEDLFFAPCLMGQQRRDGVCQGAADLALWDGDVSLAQWGGRRRALARSQTHDAAGKYRFPQAVTACASLDAAGHRDWRLPSYMELRTPALYLGVVRRLWVHFVVPDPARCAFGDVCLAGPRLAAAQAAFDTCLQRPGNPPWDQPLPGDPTRPCRQVVPARCLGEVCPPWPVFWFQLGTAGPPPVESLFAPYPGPWAFSPFDPQGHTVHQMFSTRAAAILCVRAAPAASR